MSEVRALLLTDVVDSSQLTETLGDAEMAALWAAHDRLARDLLPAWRGQEIDKSDGMLLLFEAAPDAVAYALAYQRGLATLKPPLKARAGLHVGPVILRENSTADVARGAKPLEVEGTAKAMAARVMSIASGGQTLLSGEARRALGEIALRFESHGHWRMKGFAEPIELFEAGDDDAPFTPPPDAAKAYRVVRQSDLWLPVRNVKLSLPAERDPFVGRRETLVELAGRFDAGARLVSVVGIGGAGKTRLVTRFAWNWLGDFPGGAWFCDLSQARSLDGIVHAVAEGLDVPLGMDDPVIQLGHAIAARRQCLVILDNFEQVARYAEETLGRWLNRASNAQFLVTTREVLGLSGEQVLSLMPLQSSEAVTLFMRRAEAAKADFQVNTADSSVITRLVDLLDCLPLAIELAAARVRVMPPSVLLSRMSDRFNLLSSAGWRSGRQATLRAVLDWSWDLLSFPEKAALAQLSVFEGGFTLESVEAVLDLSAYENSPLPMDALQSLVQKSFVRQVADTRFDLLVSVKEYASEHLRTEGRYPGSGPAALRAAEVRHGAYVAGKYPNLDESVIRGAEIDNFVAACRRAVARGDGDVAAKALAVTYVSLRARGPFRLAVELASVVRAIPRLGSAASALVEFVTGTSLSECGKESEACEHLEAALVGARRVGDRLIECKALTWLGALEFNAGRIQDAHSRLETALAVARESGNRGEEPQVRTQLGEIEAARGRMSEARAHCEAALELARELGGRNDEGHILAHLGMLYVGRGSIDEGTSNLEKALAVAREVGNRYLEGQVLRLMGRCNWFQGRLDDAHSQLEAALAVARNLGDARFESGLICDLGMVYESMARPDKALDHFEAALVIARELEDRSSEGEFLGYMGLLHARQSRYDEARGCLDAGEALLRAVSGRATLGILLCGRAETEHLTGNPDAARATLAEAETFAGAVSAGPGSELGLAVIRVRDLLGK